MEHVKGILEFEDFSDLMGELSAIGIEPLKGWLIIITNIHGLTTCEIVIEKDWPQAVEKYSDYGMIKGQQRGLVSYLGDLKKRREIINWDILDGFAVRGSKRGYKKWDASDPYTTVKILDSFFSNSETILKKISVNKLTFPEGLDTLQEFK